MNIHHKHHHVVNVSLAEAFDIRAVGTNIFRQLGYDFTSPFLAFQFH